jgi:hypothetical protein
VGQLEIGRLYDAGVVAGDTSLAAILVRSLPAAQPNSTGPASAITPTASHSSRAALEAGMQTAESQEAQRRLLEDEATFIDFARSRVFMTEEHVIFDGAPARSADESRPGRLTSKAGRWGR